MKEDISPSCNEFRSLCPAAKTLDILGDRWTLLVIRDLLLGEKTYGELQKSPENIPTNILADRLKRLQHEAIIDKKKYQDKPVRYTYGLTQKGIDLKALLLAAVKWGHQYYPEGTLSLGEITDLLVKDVFKT